MPSRTYLVYPQGAGVPTPTPVVPPVYNWANDIVRAQRQAKTVVRGHPEGYKATSGLLVNSGSTIVPGGSFVAPVTWMTAIGGTQAANYSSSTWRQLAAKYNLVEYAQDANTDGAMTGGFTVASSMADVQSRAAALGNALCKTGIYTIDERNFSSFNSYPQFRVQCNTNNWWLLTSYPSGSIVTGDSGGSNLVNNSIFSPAAISGIATGKNVNQYFADYILACFVNGNGAPVGESSFTMHANPNLDFIVRDNQFSGTRAAGAWQETTTSYPIEFNNGPFQIATFLQQGHAQDINRMRAANPALLYGGNCDQIDYLATSGSGVVPIDPTFQNLYDFPFAEAPIGTISSSYTYVSFQALINLMIRFEQLLRSGGICIFNNHTGPAPLNSSTNVLWPNNQANWGNTFLCGYGTQNGWNANFWQAARFIICTGLLRGWAVCVESDTANTWFYMDEFNNGNANTFNWFGSPVGAYQSSPAFAIGSLGVWMMTYQNVRVLVNPVGNGAVTLPSSFSGHKMSAGPLCDPSVNNGAAFGTAYSASALTMQNGDGLVVLP